jgi:hypothetical protein
LEVGDNFVDFRDAATYGKLIIDTLTAPKECENAGLAVNLSKVVYLRSTDYEFNITSWVFG